ncbi:unnamed protein product [Phytophthora lilii]|uniref:Unnamed protein product n=1 Tax=Phytophthora lilii TaxID=2077276 RepID=A0A9W7CRV6_9STRA|nr:unnamed protein product [Phytophthora lilii]
MEETEVFEWPFQDVDTSDDDIWEPCIPRSSDEDEDACSRTFSSPRDNYHFIDYDPYSYKYYEWSYDELDEGLYNGYDDWENYWDSIYG